MIFSFVLRWRVQRKFFSPAASEMWIWINARSNYTLKILQSPGSFINLPGLYFISSCREAARDSEVSPALLRGERPVVHPLEVQWNLKSFQWNLKSPHASGARLCSPMDSLPLFHFCFQKQSKQTGARNRKDMNQSPQFSHLLYSNSWTLTQIGRDRQRSVARVGNIHQGGDTLESTFELLRPCNPPRSHVALLRVFRRVVVSVFCFPEGPMSWPSSVLPQPAVALGLGRLGFQKWLRFIKLLFINRWRSRLKCSISTCSMLNWSAQIRLLPLSAIAV